MAATLMAIATSTKPATTRLAGPASAELILLDLAMLATIATTAPTATWPMALAVPASLTRLTLTARNLPKIFAQ